MSSEDTLPKSEDCNCLAARQAARHVTQFYDLIMAPAGLRTSQFSLLAKLQRLGPLSINALAAEMVMDRTTLGRTIRPLVRDGFIVVTKETADRRSKQLRLTDRGAERLREAVKHWMRAQDRFDEIFGTEQSANFRAVLHAVTAHELTP